MYLVGRHLQPNHADMYLAFGIRWIGGGIRFGHDLEKLVAKIGGNLRGVGQPRGAQPARKRGEVRMDHVLLD